MSSTLSTLLIHVPADQEMASYVSDNLVSAGIRAYSTLEITDHQDSFQKAVQESQYGLFFYSSRSIEDSLCRNNLQEIASLGKQIYVVKIENLPTEEFPYWLMVYRFIDLTQDCDDNLNQLIRILKKKPALKLAVPQRTNIVSGPFPQWHLDLPLIGRTSELAAVTTALAGGYRTVTIVGMSGVGKTRLAAEVSTDIPFTEGIIWHQITPESTFSDLIALIRNHLNVDNNTADDVVWATLGHHQVLLILDGGEDCSDPITYAEWLNRLNLNGGTRVLLTTRQRWNRVRDSWCYELQAPSHQIATEIVRIMAEKEPVAYPITGYEQNIATAAHNRPKLIWYAVRWADAYPPEYVLELLKKFQGVDAQDAYEDLVAKSLRMVEAYPEWPTALAALQKVAVCQGGFSFDAARAIIGEPQPLALLKKWGLLSLISGRYEIDPLLLPRIEIDYSAQPAHFQYYKSFAAQCTTSQDYRRLSLELYNLQAAYKWAIQADQVDEAFELVNICGDFLSSWGRFEQRRNWLEQIAKRINKRTDPAKYAAIQVSLGVAYQERNGPERRTSLYESLTAFEEALHVYTPQRAPLDYATVQNNMGISYRALAEIENKPDYFKQAIAAFKNALRYFTPQSDPFRFASTESNLGGAYICLAEREERVSNLWEAVFAFRKALAYFSPQKTPLEYAATQHNLGAAYAAYAEVGNRQEYLRRALAAFERSAEVCPPQRAPMRYARTQYMLGIVLRDLAEVEERENNLQRAVTAFEQTLRFWTLRNSPANSAQTWFHLADTYYQYSTVGARMERLEKAAYAYQQALSYYTVRHKAMYYLKIKVVLGIIFKQLGRSEEATACWREAERYFRNHNADDVADNILMLLAGNSDPQ